MINSNDMRAGSFFEMPALSEIDPQWNTCQFVFISNARGVTLLKSRLDLSPWVELNSPRILTALSDISGVSSQTISIAKCGINRRWAALLSEGSFAGCVFERGKGPTCSYGTRAAAAVLCVRLVKRPDITVTMPGRVVPLIAIYGEGSLRLKSFDAARSRLPIL